MESFDLLAIQAHYEERLHLVQQKLGGAANHKRFIGITEAEHTEIVALEEMYLQYENAMIRFLTACADLIRLGDPVMPTLAVPESMLATLAREADENAAFKSAFVAAPAEPVASQIGAGFFGDPIPKV